MRYIGALEWLPFLFTRLQRGALKPPPKNLEALEVVGGSQKCPRRLRATRSFKLPPSTSDLVPDAESFAPNVSRRS